MARKRKTGPRTAKGRLARGRAAWDHGNDRIAELEARFTHRDFHNGKAAPFVKSPIGRAWAVGLLDGYGVDPAVIRDAGLDYAARYWGYWPSTTCVSNYDSEDRRGCWGDERDPRGHWFMALDRAMLGAGRGPYDAAQSLVVDCHWFPHDNPPWLDRLINERLLKARRPVAGRLPIDTDQAMLDLAVRGLMCIIVGSERIAA